MRTLSPQARQNTIVTIENGTIYFKSDNYFNDPDSHKPYEDMGFDVQPVDVFGGFVPQDKSLGNLKKTEKAIHKKFKLGGEG